MLPRSDNERICRVGAGTPMGEVFRRCIQNPMNCIDVIAGYDFGMFRLEGEASYKRAKHSKYTVDANAPGPFPGGVTRGTVNNSANGRRR